MATRGSTEWKDNISRGTKGRIPWNKGKKGVQISFIKGKKRWWKSPGSFKKGHIPWNTGTKLSNEIKEKISISRKGKRSVWGNKQWNWKGGITSKNEKARNSYRYKDWRQAVFKRDNYTCQICGQKGGYLEADHMKSFAEYPKLRYIVDNGRTLCRPCHIKVTFNLSQGGGQNGG